MIDQTRNSGRAGSAVDELFESRVAAAMRGDREAFAVLFGQRVRAVSGCVAALADSDIRADLVVVQTFVRAWRELPELPTPRQFNLWLRGIAEQEIGATRSQETDPGEAGSQPDAPAAALRRAIAIASSARSAGSPAAQRRWALPGRAGPLLGSVHR